MNFISRLFGRDKSPQVSAPAANHYPQPMDLAYEEDMIHQGYKRIDRGEGVPPGWERPSENSFHPTSVSAQIQANHEEMMERRDLGYDEPRDRAFDERMKKHEAALRPPSIESLATEKELENVQVRAVDDLAFTPKEDLGMDESELEIGPDADDHNLPL